MRFQTRSNSVSAHNCHHPRKRVIQYSREVSFLIERPWRTGCPAFAGHDDLLRKRRHHTDIKVRDCNGAQLAEGDTVTLIKDSDRRAWSSFANPSSNRCYNAGMEQL